MTKSEDKSSHRGSIYRHMARGSAWAVAMRWGIRGVGFFSVLILARILTPEDFGVVAMGALVMGFVTGFTELGVQMLLIREPDATREHCDTAWTVKIIQACLVAGLLVLLAPVAAHYFAEPRVTPVIYVLAMAAIVTGFENIGMVLARKELDFAKDFRFNFYKRLVQFVATISLAFALRSYWALVGGQVITSVLGVILSYRMHSYRPRWCLQRVQEYLRFSYSIVPLRIGRFLHGKADVLVVGGLTNTAQLGAYNVASELSAILTREIEIPLARGLMPNYAKLVHDRQQLMTAFLHVVNAVGIILVPISLGLWATAEGFVAILLGEKWASTVPLIKWLAIYGCLTGLIHLLSGQILIVVGHERVSAVLTWVRLVILLPAVIWGGVALGAEGVAIAATCSAASAFPLIVWSLWRYLGISPVKLMRVGWRPIAAGALMVLGIEIVGMLNIEPLVARFVVEVAMAVIVYSAALLFLWWVSGRPESLERVIVNFVTLRRRTAV